MSLGHDGSSPPERTVPDFQKRAAILGAGFGTRVTVPALRAEGWDVRALFSRRPERAEAIATKLEIPHH